MSAWLRAWADRYFPDRQVLVRGTGRIVAIGLPRETQLVLVLSALVLTVWLTLSAVGCAVAFGGRAEAALAVARLSIGQARDKAEIARLDAQLASLRAARDAALADARASRDDASRREAASQAAAAADIAAANAANHRALDGLAAQTAAEIGRVEAIIKSTGLDPASLASGSLAAPPTAKPQARNLAKDLRALDRLAAVLADLPLSPPLARLAVSSGFGPRADPFTGRPEFHVGVDLTGAVGTPVFATAPGTVTFAGTETGYGYIVIIDHGHGLSTRYSHLEKILPHVGESVSLHQEIGLLGNTGWSTGPHLLYETRVDGQPRDPLDFIKVSASDVQG